jgi:intraflagellar transport protein 52
MSYPQNKVLMAVCQAGAGKLLVTGSCDMFTDDYFEKEDNSKIFEVILKYLLGGDVVFAESDQVHMSQNDQEHVFIPDI